MLTFSIGIPAFKIRFLKECIDSILSQDYSNFELIIIDDCSPEPIGKIVAEYSDSRIKYYRNFKNNGAENVVDNWNKCLENSTGDYFVLMGDDDKLESNYLQEFLNLISKYPDLDIYHCRSKIINEDSIPFSITPINPEYEDVYDFILCCLKYYRQQYISDFVYKASTLKLRGGFYKLPLAWESDYLSAWIASTEKGIAHTNNTVFNYRSNQYSITSTNDINSIILKAKATLQCEQWIYNFIENTPQEINKHLKHSLIRTALAEHTKVSRTNTIRQIMRHASTATLTNIIRIKNELHISYREIALVCISLIVSKLRK
jgi:glycosyltransferase involved in cell wall biosynthesis